MLQIAGAIEVIIVGSQAILGTAHGWRDRLVKVQTRTPPPPSGEPQFIGWCLDKEDLCVAKLCALREKDQNFVDALRSP
jgi:hypothetical protein